MSEKPQEPVLSTEQKFAVYDAANAAGGGHT